MARFYGIYIKGKPNNILNLTKLSNFERTSHYKSEELYTLKDIVKLTTKYNNEKDFKLDLFYSGVISLEDLTKELVIRNYNNTKENKKIGRTINIIYKPYIELFKPSVIKQLYLNKTNIPEDYNFLVKLLKEFKPYSRSYDKQRYTSEIYYDALYNIITNYENRYYSIEELKSILNNFINHEIYYVIGESTPNGYDRQINYQYRIDKRTGRKQIDLYSLYKLVLFYINNNLNIDNNLKQEIEINSPKTKKKIKKEIEGQIVLGDN